MSQQQLQQQAERHGVVFEGLPASWSDAQLEALVSECGGPLLSVSISRHFTSGESRGSAVVVFGAINAARAAVQVFDGATIDEHTLRVTHAGARSHRTIVVGAGLAGFCAAIEAARAGSHVVLLEKSARTGGNSAKASSGISVAFTQQHHHHDHDHHHHHKEAADKAAHKDASEAPTEHSQREADHHHHHHHHQHHHHQCHGEGGKDSLAGLDEQQRHMIDAMVQDTLKSGGDHSDPKLVATLVENSPRAFGFLAECGVDLSAVCQCGGHSTARTYRNTVADDAPLLNVGAAILNKMREAASKLSNLTIMCNADVKELLLGADGRHVVGVAYLHSRLGASGTVIKLAADAVVVTAGGYAYNREMLPPHAANLPTTNASSATGDGISLCQRAGAVAVQLDQVQIHPTAFVDPKRMFAREKWLAPEALRGCGGVLVNSDGKRFVDELSYRNVLSDAILANCQRLQNPNAEYDRTSELAEMAVAFVLLSRSMRLAFGAKMLDFYQSRGMVTQCASLADAATTVIGCAPETLRESVLQRLKQQSNEHAAEDELDGVWYVGRVTPGVHYTMGGIAMNTKGQALRASTMAPIQGLFVAGEVTGGVHGANRLAGNSLLECVVFGRIAGRNAAHHEHFTPTLAPGEYTPLPLHERTFLSKSTALFRFRLPSRTHQAGLELGQYVSVRANIAGELLVRYYSPVSRPDDWGFLELLIKTDTGGAMTKHLMELAPGEALEFSGPYPGPELELGTKHHIGLLAGGTGIAPMIQLIRAHLLFERKFVDVPKFDLRLVYAAKDQDEILLREVLERHASKHPNLQLFYSLMEPPADWTMGVGFVTKDMIQCHLPPPGDDCLVVICGPPPFCAAMKKACLELGYTLGRDLYSYM